MPRPRPAFWPGWPSGFPASAPSRCGPRNVRSSIRRRRSTPSDAIEPDVANQLLEPGSGVPDVKKILERVRAGQTGRNAPPSESDKADFIAAARRAAQLAAEEVDTLNRGKSGAAPSSIGGAFARHRRPILMAVGAVLLAIMSYPLVNTLIRGDQAPVEAPVAAIEQPVTNETPVAAERRNGNVAPAMEATDTDVEPLSTLQPQAEEQYSRTGRGRRAADGAAGNSGVRNSCSRKRSCRTPRRQCRKPAWQAPGCCRRSSKVPHRIRQRAWMARRTRRPRPKPYAAGRRRQPRSSFPPRSSRKRLPRLPRRAIRWRCSKSAPSIPKAAASRPIWPRLRNGISAPPTRASSPAEYRLASLYEKGTGVGRDLTKARDALSAGRRKGQCQRHAQSRGHAGKRRRRGSGFRRRRQMVRHGRRSRHPRQPVQPRHPLCPRQRRERRIWKNPTSGFPSLPVTAMPMPPRSATKWARR